MKAAATVRAEDFRHLRKLRDRLGADLVAGIIIYTGPDPIPFGDSLFAVPCSHLWGGARPPL